MNKNSILQKTMSGLLVAGMLLFTSCGQTTKPSTAASEPSKTTTLQADPAKKGTALKDGILDIATNATFPPYESYEGSKIVGIDVEIAEAIGAKLGYKVQMHDMEFPNILASINSGKVDAGIAGLTVDEERQKSVNFSESYTTAVQSIIVKKDSGIKSTDDLKDKKIGTQIGTTGDMYAKDDFGESNVQSFDKGADAVLALSSGKISAVIIDDIPAKNFVGSNPQLQVLSTSYATESYAIAVSKENKALLDEINGALAELKADGTVQKIIDKYIPAKG